MHEDAPVPFDHSPAATNNLRQSWLKFVSFAAVTLTKFTRRHPYVSGILPAVGPESKERQVKRWTPARKLMQTFRRPDKRCLPPKDCKY